MNLNMPNLGHQIRILPNTHQDTGKCGKGNRLAKRWPGLNSWFNFLRVLWQFDILLFFLVINNQYWTRYWNFSFPVYVCVGFELAFLHFFIIIGVSNILQGMIRRKVQICNTCNAFFAPAFLARGGLLEERKRNLQKKKFFFKIKRFAIIKKSW